MNKPSNLSMFSIANIGLFVAIVGSILLSVIPVPDWYVQTFQSLYQLNPNDAISASQSSFYALAIIWLVIVLWLTEALPLPVTALLPAIAIPFFSLLQVKKGSVQELSTTVVLSNYASSIVFLFLGGFILAQALTRHKVEQRWATWLLSKQLFSKSPQRIILGIMFITAFISMWVNNTATAALIVPLALGISKSLREGSDNNEIIGLDNFTTIAVLSVAWSASIGGIGTLVGSAPNGIAVANLKQATGQIISFTDWAMYGFPIMLFIIPISWKMLFFLIPVDEKKFKCYTFQSVEHLPTTSAQKWVILIFFFTAFLWITIPFITDLGFFSKYNFIEGFTEWTIPLVCSLLFFLIPEGKGSDKKLLVWEDVQKIDWGTLLLFGGGLALSALLFQTGTMEVCTKLLVNIVGNISEPLLSILFGVFSNIATELFSNVALVSIVSPMAISIAKQMSFAIEPLIMIVAITASLGFMLPMGTPPNAIAYSTGKVPLKVMITCGFLLNLISTIISCVWILFVYSLKS